MRAWILVAIAGCTADPIPVGTQRGACQTLEGKTFTSVTEHECGLGSNGPTACHWHVAITAGDGTSSSMTWSHSDVGETLTVTCTGLAITSATPAYSGTFDPTIGALTWDSVDYAE